MKIIQTNLFFTCDDSFEMPAYHVRPTKEARYPGVVFVHEAFGLNAEMKRLAEEIATAGYVVLIPELFSRGSWFLCIRKLMRDLSREVGRGVNDLLAARRWLSKQSVVDAERLAVVGLCLGGGFAMVLAKTGLFQVAAPFYGAVPKNMQGSCPIVASFGAKDKMMLPGAERLERQLELLNVDADIKIYSGVGHGFMNPAPNRFISMLAKHTPLHAGYDASAAMDAMARLLRFLDKHLKSTDSRLE